LDSSSIKVYSGQCELNAGKLYMVILVVCIEDWCV